ncbi:uroporphyrinogen-III C-methyltransferase [Psychrosphaera sp. B3R10]|uniref:uroporphyrinogen-III C-methyltransferase n=1 Tax=unclassified Psychrosphaera TaxID=2641570 RepID=UPI001C086D62|nr:MULTISPECIES: uroporphyrinogen-III C-methyltransferase [unclassified Psychrosphaera]MBU2883139.1 uroporphyrinogen-III C-methyltransferase [Psychrosphaera sp. I2R16]MBU2988595.1 uroporphyrinogen-III C-methyltransferase [Psychrosphaera sp. B3R10]
MSKLTDAAALPNTRLLNTRPSPMAEELSALCEQVNVETHVAPIITTAPFAKETLDVSLTALLKNTPDPDFIWIFVSRTAVRHFATYLLQNKIAFMPKGKIIAVGPGSRDELIAAFSHLNDQIICPEESNSESLILLPDLNDDKKINAAILKGKGGRDVIKRHIESQLGVVTEVDLYERQVTKHATNDIKNWLTADFILATSIDIADGIFENVVSAVDKAQISTLTNKNWIVISHRIRDHVIALGVDKNKVKVSEHTTNQSIIQLLTQWQGEISMSNKDNKTSTTQSSSKEAPALNKDKQKQEAALKKPDTSEKSVDEAQNKSNEALKKLEQQVRAENEAIAKEKEKIAAKATATTPPETATNPKATESKTQTKSKPTSKTEHKTAQTEPTPKQTAKPHNTSKESNSRLSKTAVFALLLSFVAIGAIGFVWWQGQMWLKTQSQVETLNQQAVNNNVAEIKNLKSQISQLSGQLNSQLKVQQSQDKSIANNVKTLTNRVKELGQSQPNEWLASEALYLVNLAERKIIIDQDVDTALMLLANANNRLAAMNDPSVFPLRQSISEDVAKLHGAKQPDRDSLYLSLSGILDQVNTLKFSHIYIPTATAIEPDSAVSDEIQDWQANLKTSFNRFMTNFVTIKHRELAIEPQIPAQQQWFIRANITRQLLIAQQNILLQNNALYNDGIVRSLSWMQQYFDLNDPQVVATINTLSELQNRNIELNLPTKLGSQSELTNYVSRQQSRMSGQ